MRRRGTAFIMVMFLALSVAAQAEEIIEATKAGDLARVEELVSSSPQLVNTIDEAGRTPLHWAARGVHVEILSYLIGKDAAVNSQDNNLVTPLHSVCSRGHVEAARILLDNGADPGATMFEQSTPLHLAVSNGSEGLVALLVEKGASLKGKNAKEDTPLHTAAHTGKWDLVDLIASDPSIHSVDALDSADFDGNTILHLACQIGRLETVQALASKVPDINLRNTLGQTAYNIAIEKGFGEIADYLSQRGAETSPQEFPILTGPYLGQTPPDTIPKLFAKGIISTRIGMYGTVVFAPDGQEAFWKPEIPKMFFMRREGDVWGAPTVFPYEGKINVPFLSADGERLYVMIEPGDNEEIWYFTRAGESWNGPQPLDSAINSKSMHWQFSIDSGGDLYFSGLQCARFIDGKYTPPEPLPSPPNSTGGSQEKYREGLVGPCISPDGDFLIFTKFGADRQFPVQLLVSFREGDGSWTEPRSLSERLQTEGNDSAPRISPDGRYLFFQSVREGSGASRGLYWVSAEVIDRLRP